jgi:hypothetical protein
LLLSPLQGPLVPMDATFTHPQRLSHRTDALSAALPHSNSKFKLHPDNPTLNARETVGKFLKELTKLIVLAIIPP